MKAVAEAIIELARDRRHVGGAVGVMAVLHSWPQQLVYHPHVHCLVTGGGVSDDPAFVKQILNIAEREGKTDIQHHRQTNDLGRGFEIAERVAGHVGDITKLRPSAQAQVPLTLPPPECH